VSSPLAIGRSRTESGTWWLSFTVTGAQGGLQEHRYLGVADGEAVGKAYLSVAGPSGVASIYGMFVPPEARGRGVAGGLTTTMLRRAKERGLRRAVLHSTDMAVGVYRRAGFVERCTITVFATGSLWSDEH
jgi:ribosomal protein S18 acetylase RimI-like enzyme